MPRTHTIYPDEFPASWASDWGEDDNGLWMEFNYRDVIQRFRWCEPGTFMMGSPVGEEGRYSDEETQHEVTLSEGFWLGDVVVTQALWEVFMGNNPSRFKGAKRPVERVSWDDAQSFVAQLNGMRSDLNLYLPSEAQWEYACRAGTTTPFHFGEQINPKWVNYDGHSPYNGGEKGEYRRETVEVKSLPCNDWGFYEMHGNVWEWCNDGFGDYPTQPVSDPAGREAGEGRVLRGGSWISSGGHCRSAHRGDDRSGNRDGSFGFRLAQGH